MSAANHANAARELLDEAKNVPAPSDRRRERVLLRAQVEATLAVAEALLELKDEGMARRVLPLGSR